MVDENASDKTNGSSEEDDLDDAVLTSVNEAIMSVENEPSPQPTEQQQPVKKPSNIIPEIEDVEDPEEMVQILRPLGIHPVQLLPGGESWFHLGARNQSLDMLKFAAVHQLDVNQVNHEGMSPLLEACLTAKDIDLLKWLVDIGADAGLMSPFGETAFDLASENEALITADLDFLKAK